MFTLLVWATGPSPGCSSPEGVTNSANPAGADGGDTGGADASVAAGPTGDSLPMGAISLFNRSSCPSGWALLPSAAGRTLVPTVGDQTPGAAYGKPLDDSEDRQHSHAMPATIDLPSVNYAGIVGEGNHNIARAGSVPLTVTGSKASAGLPYVQLLVCHKQVPPDLGQRTVPAGTLMFFQSACPTGWGQSGTTQGRILIGVPEGATGGQKFGGAALNGTDKRPLGKHRRCKSLTLNEVFGVIVGFPDSRSVGRVEPKSDLSRCLARGTHAAHTSMLRSGRPTTYPAPGKAPCQPAAAVAEVLAGTSRGKPWHCPGQQLTWPEATAARRLPRVAVPRDIGLEPMLSDRAEANDSPPVSGRSIDQDQPHAVRRPPQQDPS